MYNGEHSQTTDWDDHSRRVSRFYKSFIPSLIGGHPFRQIGLLLELMFNPVAVFFQLLQWGVFSSLLIRIPAALLVPAIFFLTPSILGVNWQMAVALVTLWIAASVLINLVTLFINASILHLQHDVSLSINPSEDMWRHLSSPLKLQRLIAGISRSSDSPARRIPLLLLSKRLEHGIVDMPKVDAADESERILVFADFDTYDYSVFLCDCIDLSWESLHWVVDPGDFRDDILPSFIAEAVVIAGLINFDKKRAELLQLRHLVNWASGLMLKRVFNKVTNEPESDACNYCPKKCDQTHCHELDFHGHSQVNAVPHSFHTNLSLLWSTFYAYASKKIDKHLNCAPKRFLRIWNLYDGFSITSVLPHAERFRSSATQSKKRFIYVDTDSPSVKSVLTALRLVSDSNDNQVNHVYVRSINPAVNVSNYCIERWSHNESQQHDWSDQACKCLFGAAFALFEASCGPKGQVSFFVRESGGSKCVEEWRKTIKFLEQQTGIVLSSSGAEGENSGGVGAVSNGLTVDFGVFDQLFCIGSVKGIRAQYERNVIGLFPCPPTITAPFALPDEGRTLQFKEVLKWLR
ncbi:MAG: hypothetical protein JW720_02690 [Sedimentisphaerales bacterium]|nr:hypothetical protein [Sedimentisphaerales bacterium]